MRNYTISYAQNREDVILDAFLVDVVDGFYVDVGANHPEHDSVTKLFYDKGWRGINIEPTKRLFELLEEQRPEDTNLNIGVSNYEGKLNFREYEGFGDGLSTFSDDMKQHYEASSSETAQHTRKFHDRTVRVTTLATIFADQKVGDINFLKVDVEGYEYEVLEGNDWKKYRPQLICIEANHVNHDWHPLLKKANYTKVFHDGLNEYFVADEHKAIAERFSYVQGLIGRPILPLAVSNDIHDQSVLNKRLETERLQLKRLISEQEKKIFQLAQELQDQQRVMHVLALLARSIDAAIIRRILKLDSHSPRATKKALVAPTVPQKNASKQALIAAAATNDLENFYSTKTKHAPSVRHFIFVVILQSYQACRSLAKFLLVGLVRLLRKARRGNR